MSAARLRLGTLNFPDNPPISSGDRKGFPTGAEGGRHVVGMCIDSENGYQADIPSGHCHWKIALQSSAEQCQSRRARVETRLANCVLLHSTSEKCLVFPAVRVRPCSAFQRWRCRMTMSSVSAFSMMASMWLMSNGRTGTRGRRDGGGVKNTRDG